MPALPLRPVLLAVASLVVLPLMLSCRSSGAWENSSRRSIDLPKQLEACRREHAAQVSTAELDSLRAEMGQFAILADRETRRQAAMQRVMDTYSRGVCLIHGVFTFRERRNDALMPVSDAEGKLLELEYLGSGFLVGEGGQIVTNRHVAQPWWNNKAVAPLLAEGLQPALLHLSVTFPDREPVAVDPESIRLGTGATDVAVLVAPIEDVPILPLSDLDPRALRGERLMLLGYPTGLAALLARADPEVASAAIAEARDTSTLILALSRRHAITPVITHGTLTEVTSSQLIYDAVTTSGGSGGPVFGPSGEVIGVNFAMLRDFQGSNYGVPIRFARPLLERQIPR